MFTDRFAFLLTTHAFPFPPLLCKTKIFPQSGLNTEQNKNQAYTCPHQTNKNYPNQFRLNNTKNHRSHHHHRKGRHTKPSIADDDLDFSSLEDSNNSQYEGMDSATGPLIESSETTASNDSSSPDNEIRNRNYPPRTSRKRTRNEAMPECNDVIDDLVIRSKKFSLHLDMLAKDRQHLPTFFKIC